MKNDGGPAFPKPIGWNGLASNDEHKCSPEAVGMSLRDWFAGQALQGLLSCPEAEGDEQPKEVTSGDDWFPYLSHRAYQFADSMLKAREVVP